MNHPPTAVGGIALLEILHHPDVAAVRAETSEEHRIADGGPDWIVNPHVRIIKLENLFRLTSIERRDPERFVSKYIHDARVIGRERHVRATGNLRQNLRLTSIQPHLHCDSVSSTRAAKDHGVTRR